MLNAVLSSFKANPYVFLTPASCAPREGGEEFEGDKSVPPPRSVVPERENSPEPSQDVLQDKRRNRSPHVREAVARSPSPFGLQRTANPSGDPPSVKYGSAGYFMMCGVGGMISCGSTHTAMVPLDMVKCRIQVDPEKYTGIVDGFKTTIAEEGYQGLTRGWLPTLIGYSIQGTCKFGFYEAFKVLYSNLVGHETAYNWRTTLYLMASASAEFLADFGLAPFEACKVRIQTSPEYSASFVECFSYIKDTEGLGGFYKGLVPLWGRQVPYTMMKFASFERTVEMLYTYVVPKPREQMGKGEQLGVTFVAGYIAGIFCAIVSHPADTIVSKLNQDPEAKMMDVATGMSRQEMWKGLTARIIMIGTLTALQWFIYDGFKVAANLPRPPPPGAKGSH